VSTILPVVTKVEKGDDQPAHHLNFIDRTISLFSPSYGVKALQARTILHQFGYNDTPERRGKAKPIRGSETWIADRDRLKAMADARDAAQYDWIGGVLAKVVLYVCGRLHCKSTTGDEALDQAYDDYFHGWCGDERDVETGRTRCDYTGRHRFLKQVQMALLAFLVDGDHGFVEVEPVYDPNTGVPIREFSLQNIEADRIGSPNDSTTDEHYIGGVGLNPERGSVEFYRVFQRTRSNQYTNHEDVPVEAFIHVFDPDRADEYRGRTKLLRILNDLRDLRETIEAEKIAGKVQSQFAAMFTTKDPFKNTGPDAWSGQTKEGTPTQDAMWGKILRMGEGEQISMMSPASRPSGSAMALWQMLIRKMANALNLPYGFLWDLLSLGGVTARIEVQGALRQIQYWQDNVLKSLILDRVRQKVLAQGIAQQLIPGHPNWKKCEWHFGPWITTDAGYEMQNDIAGVGFGVIPISDVAGKYGYTPREVFVSNATAANTAISVGEENQLPVEVFAKGLWPDITAQKAAYLTPTPIPPPPAGSIDVLGDKGVKQLLDLFKGVGDGTIDRESAKQTLMTVFGLDEATAEEMCPEEPSTEDLNRAAGLDAKGRHAPVAGGNGSNGSKPKKSSTKKMTARLDRIIQFGVKTRDLVLARKAASPQPPGQVININMPAQTAQEAPVVNFSMPELPAPVVTLNVPEQKAPVVNVDGPVINVESPTINVEPAVVQFSAPPVQVRPPNVVVNVPKAEPPRIEFNAPQAESQVQKVTRDAKGNITGSVTKMVYKKKPKSRKPIK